MRVRLKSWATNKLKAGDLTALASMIHGGMASEPNRLRRLASRRFVTESGDGHVSVTARGRMALAIKRLLTFH